MNLTALPAFSDNYIWMLDDGRAAIVVDPGEAAPVENALDARALALVGILVTHHHADHVGGVDALRARLDGSVFGPAHERVPQPFEPLEDAATIELIGCRFRVIEVPGHTAGHIAYFTDSAPGAPILFCGDTLFSGGCGRLFEGTPQQMHDSLSKLAALPASTRVCCAHEYTLSNLKFARAVEPSNQALLDYEAWCIAERAQLHPTLPSSIERERAVNPFLRCAEPAVKRCARERGVSSDEPADVLASLREWKNTYR
jgi:hydroxyacylglutathione hydrolase